MSHPVVRAAAPADLHRLLPLMREFYDAGRLPWGDAPGAAMAALLQDAALGTAWLIETAESDVGYLVLTWGWSLEFGGRIGLVDELYVRPEWRGAGLGSRALEAAASACRVRGAFAVRLEVDHANPGAARLYGRHGFVAHERHIMTLRQDV